MTWTTPITFTTGQVVTAAQGNTHWRDNPNYLYGGIASDSRPNFVVRQTATQSPASGSETTLVWNTADRDNASGMVLATGIYTIPTTGIWTFAASIQWASNATGLRALHVSSSGGPSFYNQISAATDSNGKVSVGATFLCTAGQTVKAAGFQNSGGSLATSGDVNTLFAGVWIGG